MNSTSERYLTDMRRRLAPAVAAYGSDPDGRRSMAGALDAWHRICAETGAADTVETRMAVVAAIRPLLEDDSLTGDELRDSMATAMLSLISQ